MFREWTFVAIVFLSTSASADGVLTMFRAIERALQNSPLYITAKNQLESAELEYKNSAAAFLPSLDLTTSHGVRGLHPDPAGLTEKTSNVSAASITLSENFYDNGESSKKYRIAQLKKELAELTFEKIKAQTIRTVALAYFRHNIEQENVKLNSRNYQELERLAKLSSDQYHQGLKTRKDFLSFKTKAQRGRLEVLSSQKTFSQARGDLRIALGLTDANQIRLDDTVVPVLPKKALELKLDPSELYEAKVLQLQERIGELEVDLARRKIWPELNLVGRVDYGSSDYWGTDDSWADHDSTQWSVLLNLKFNIVDWGVRSRNIRLAQNSTFNEQQGLRSTLLVAQKELEVFQSDLTRAEESYRISKELQKMEEDTFKILERDYKSGSASYLELTTGLANLLDARSRSQEAEFSQAELYLKWKYYKGILNEKTVLE